MGPYVVVAFFLLAAGLVASLVRMGIRAERARVEALRSLAAGLGWTYLEQVDFDAVPDLDRFELFTAGRRKRLSNLLASPAGERRSLTPQSPAVSPTTTRPATRPPAACSATLASSDSGTASASGRVLKRTS